MLYQALGCETGPLCTPLGLVGLASSLLNSSRPPRYQVQLDLRTQENLLGLHQSFVLENCEAIELHELETMELHDVETMELHEVETMEILQVEEIDIVSAQVENLNELHRQKIDELEFEAPEHIQKVGTWRSEIVAMEVDNP